MDEKKTYRFVLIAFALFPTLWGILGLLNNASGFASTAEFAIKPMFAMSDTYGNPAQTWRAISWGLAPILALILITTVETLAGILGLIGLLKLIKNFNAPYEKLQSGKSFVVLGATLAVLVWGVGFMVIAGDWYLAWQAKTNPLNTQIGGMIYALPNMITIIIYMLHREPANKSYQ
ncbi:DUF2165 family protein [Bartonella sp. HY038]|uniref:DUF2165 family protein n=1 Tax=Bartonella sp. HY038 TaxID=2759660 RepID=UPI0015FDAA4B|nr:DUF2165 family protein [Bartonella sp. HY038]